MNEWMDGWIDGWMDAWVDGYGYMYVCVCTVEIKGNLCYLEELIYTDSIYSLFFFLEHFAFKFFA